MLAIFAKSVAQAPEELVAASSEGAKSEQELVKLFRDKYPEAAVFQAGEGALISYTHEKQALLKPRTFAVVEDIFCVFEGILENLTALKQQYGLSKLANEVVIVIEGYRTLRDRAPYPTDHMLREWKGHYSFILFDYTTKNAFIGADSQGKVPLYWGVTSEGSLAFTDDLELLKEVCCKSSSQFPAGCFFSSESGLSSFDHPLNEVVASPRNGKGKDGAFGVKFEVERPPESPLKNQTTWASAF